MMSIFQAGVRTHPEFAKFTEKVSATPVDYVALLDALNSDVGTHPKNPITPTNTNSEDNQQELQRLVVSKGFDEAHQLVAEKVETGYELIDDDKEVDEGVWWEDREEWQTALDPLNDAKNWVLTLLRCYYHNLETGGLSTSDKVDEGVADALKRILAMCEDGVSAEEEKALEEEKMAISQSLTDEQRMVDTLDNYRHQVMRYMTTPCEEVLEGAKKILSWES